MAVVSIQNKAGIHVFDKPLHKANEWIQDILRESGWTSPQLAYSALRITLQTLRDRITPDEALDFASELPMLIRGLFLESWRLTDKPDKTMKNDEDFLDRVRFHFQGDVDLDPEKVVSVILKVVSRRISSGEVRHLRHSLPESIRRLWP